MSVQDRTEAKQPPRLACPDNWALTSLASIADVALGKTPGKNDYLSKGSYKIVKYRDLGDDRQIDWTKAEKGFVDPSRADKLNLRRLAEGDVLISASAHSSEIIGRKVLHLSRLPDMFDGVFYVGEILCIRVAHEHAPDLAKLLSYFFLSLNGYKSIQAKVHGVHLIASRAAEMTVPVAPVAEQQRIVSKIDELFSRIDEGERALERVQKLVERYRQSVLKAAVTGELTREWREKNKDKLESGEALLARILKARREAWEKAELDKMKTKGITPANDVWKQKYEDAAPPSIGLNEIPKSWAQPSLEQATRADRPIAYGVLQPGPDVPDGVFLVRVCDVADGVVDLSSLKKIDAGIAAAFPRTRLFGGEVLLTLVGTVGRTGVVPCQLAGANVARAVGVLVPNEGISAAWLEVCLRHEKTRQLLVGSSREVARKTLNLEQLREVAVPVPSHQEQREALSRLGEEFSKIAAVEQTLVQQIRMATALRQATLKAAFAGQLVAQHPDDEHASALLERIAAERGADKAAPKRGRKKKTGA